MAEQLKVGVFINLVFGLGVLIAGFAAGAIFSLPTVAVNQPGLLMVYTSTLVLAVILGTLSMFFSYRLRDAPALATSVLIATATGSLLLSVMLKALHVILSADP